MLGGGPKKNTSESSLIYKELAGRKIENNVVVISHYLDACEDPEEPGSFTSEICHANGGCGPGKPINSVTLFFLDKIMPWEQRAEADGWRTEDLLAAAEFIDQFADAVWFDGGDQGRYIHMFNESRRLSKTSRNIATAVSAVFQRGGVIGGTSAGMMIQGGIIFDSVQVQMRSKAQNVSGALHSDNAVGHGEHKHQQTRGSLENAPTGLGPVDAPISLAESLFNSPPLEGILTETHIDRKNAGNDHGRFGRVAAIMARLKANGISDPKIIGCAENVAAVIEQESTGHWSARLVQPPENANSFCYFFRGGLVSRYASGQPLRYDCLGITRLNKFGSQFDLSAWQGLGNTADYSTYFMFVDGAEPEKQTQGLFPVLPKYFPEDPVGPSPDRDRAAKAMQLCL